MDKVRALRRIYGTAAALAALLGAGHIALTVRDYPGETTEGYGFAGTGLALIFGGIFNAFYLKNPGTFFFFYKTLGGNLAVLLLAVMLVIHLGDVPSLLTTAVCITLTVCCILLRTKQPKTKR